jgi:hypothetical protein
MNEKPDHDHSSPSETMTARIEVNELGDPVRQREITDAITAMDRVIEVNLAKGVLYISYDPLSASEKKIEQAVRSSGNVVKAAATDTETAHPDLPTSANVEHAARAGNARGVEHP